MEHDAEKTVMPIAGERQKGRTICYLLFARQTFLLMMLLDLPPVATTKINQSDRMAAETAESSD